MESPKLFSSEAILQKTQRQEKEFDDQRLEQSREYLESPIESFGEYSLRSEYSSVITEDDRQVISFFTDYFVQQGNLESQDCLENFKIINSLILQGVDGKEIDIFTLLPEGYRIFFYPSENSVTEIIGAVKYEMKAICIGGNINTLLTITTLFHEIGHVKDISKMEKIHVNKLVDSHVFNQQAEEIRKERAASAYALSVLRDFFDDHLIRRAMVDFLDQYALQTYCDAVNHHIAKVQAARSLESSHFDDGYGDSQQSDQEQLWDDWQDWKETEEYIAWKQMKENKDLEESEEFGAWREWVKMTKYDYQKDIVHDEALPFSGDDDEQKI